MDTPSQNAPKPHHHVRAILLSIIGIALVSVAAWATFVFRPGSVPPQQRTYVGTVNDIAGNPLEGATVSVGAAQTTTDSRGQFEIRTADQNTTLQVTYSDEAAEVSIVSDEDYNAEPDVENTGIDVDYSAPETLSDIFGDPATALEGLTETEGTALENELTQSYYPHTTPQQATDNFGVVVTIPVLTEDVDMPPLVDESTIITNSDGFQVVKGEIVVGWIGGTAEEHAQVITNAGAAVVYEDAIAQTTIATVADEKNKATVLAAIETSSLVSAAMENYVFEPDVAPNDPDYADKAKSWWLRQLHAEPTWAMSPGRANVITAVIDGGFQLNHPDLAGAYTAATLNYTTGAITDTPRHGTHVSGIIAARRNNSLGLTGIAPGTRVLPIRLRDFGRLPSVYARLASFPNVRIATMSMGFKWANINAERVRLGKRAFTNAQMQAHADAYDRLIRPAFMNYYTKGGVMCKSAGNDFGLDARMNLLNYPEVITVGAATSDGYLTNFSNVGPKVDIVAPGKDIWSTVDGSTYNKLSGTSMSTPMVCGTVAAIRSVRPNYGPLIIKRILQRSALPLDPVAAKSYMGLDTWRSLLRATKLFGVVGDVIDDEFNIHDKAIVSTEPSFWNVLPDEAGTFYLPYLQRKAWTVKGVDSDMKDSELVTAPELTQDDPVVQVLLVLEKEEDDTNTNTDTNNNTNTENDTNDNSDNETNTNENDGSETNTNTDTTNTNSGDTGNGDSTDGTSDGTTTTDDGIVISAGGCAVSGYGVPEPSGDSCPDGFTFSRDTIACEQTECPASAIGRTYTLECKCAEGAIAVYACDIPGYLVACINP